MNPISGVSVLIPCYNGARHIQKVIESLKNQTRPANEIIVVDDCSQDNTAALVEACGVRLVRHEVNRGPAAARNTAFRASQGQIVIFIDSDAYADPHMIENLLKVYEHAPDFERLGGVGGRGIETCTEGIPNRWRCLHSRQDFGNAARSEVEYLFGLCCSFRRAAFDQVHGFDEFFRINAGEDHDLGLRLSRAGWRLAYTPDAFIYHQHCDTIDSLKRVQRNWTYWSWLARARNQVSPVRAALGVLRHVVLDSLSDLLFQRDLRLVKIDLDVFWIKMRAILAARRAITPYDGQNS